MLKFMLIYPLIFGILGRFALPWLAENTGFVLELYEDFVLVVLTLLIPQIYGALLGFSILDDRDDNILISVRVTPLNLHQFLSFKVAMVLILSFLASIFVLWFVEIGELSWSAILWISFLASLGTPITGFLINAFARNKIEGFAIMKGLGTTILFPFLALFFHDAREFFFAFVPGFWPGKAISSLIRGEGLLPLTFQQYYSIGLIYVLILNAAVYSLFLRRNDH